MLIDPIGDTRRVGKNEIYIPSQPWELPSRRGPVPTLQNAGRGDWRRLKTLRLCAETLGPKSEGDGFRIAVLVVVEPPCLRRCPLLALVRFPLSRLVANLRRFTEICGGPKEKKEKKALLKSIERP